MTLFGAKYSYLHGTFFEHSKYPLLYLLTAWCYPQSLLTITEQPLEGQRNLHTARDLRVEERGRDGVGNKGWGRGGEQEFLQKFGIIYN